MSVLTRYVLRNNIFKYALQPLHYIAVHQGSVTFKHRNRRAAHVVYNIAEMRN